MRLNVVIKQLICSFNRYMVECEFVEFTNITRSRYVLIDTWWNVNSSTR